MNQRKWEKQLHKLWKSAFQSGWRLEWVSKDQQLIEQLKFSRPKSSLTLYIQAVLLKRILITLPVYSSLALTHLSRGVSDALLWCRVWMIVGWGDWFFCFNFNSGDTNEIWLPILSHGWIYCKNPVDFQPCLDIQVLSWQFNYLVLVKCGWHTDETVKPVCIALVTCMWSLTALLK